MLYILKEIGKGEIGSGKRQLGVGDLLLINEPIPDVPAPVQSDWNEADPVSPAFIKNIPEKFGSQVFRKKDITLLSGNWVFDDVLGKYVYSFEDENLAENTSIEFIPIATSENEQAVNSAVISPQTPVVVGDFGLTSASIFAKNVPLQDIIVDVLITDNVIDVQPVVLPPFGGKGL